LTRSSQSLLRMLLKAGRVVLPALVLLECASAANAAPQSTWTSRRRLTVCDPRTTAVRKAPGNRLALGSIANPSSELQSGFTDTGARVRRTPRSKFDGSEQAAIQNDTPAARTNPADTIVPMLRPIGVLGGSFARLPATASFSPRSPRGPPFPL
jgi:hypothetical protein